jgi:opacity protein-like surface antigen
VTGAFLCALALSPEAHAYERQQHLGVQLGGTLMSTPNGGTPFGGNFGLHYTYGLSDALNLVVEADISAFPVGTEPAKNPPAQPGFVSTGGVGLMYVFDVLRWVPYAGGIAGAGIFDGGYLGAPLIAPDLQLALGVDYEITRSWTIGVAYRQHFFVTQMTAYPEFTTLGLRFEYVWGW